MDQLEGRGQVDRLPDVPSAEGLEGKEGDDGPDPFAAGLDHVAGDVLEEWLFRDDALPDPGLDESHLPGHAKIQRTRHGGRPNPCYPLELFNRFRGTKRLVIGKSRDGAGG